MKRDASSDPVVVEHQRAATGQTPGGLAVDAVDRLGRILEAGGADLLAADRRRCRRYRRRSGRARRRSRPSHPAHRLDEPDDLGALGGGRSGIGEALAEIDVVAEVTLLGGAEFGELVDEAAALGHESGLIDVRVACGISARGCEVAVDLEQVPRRHAGVDLSGRDASVTEHLLDGSQVCSPLHHVGGRAVPEDVGRHRHRAAIPARDRRRCARSPRPPAG